MRRVALAVAAPVLGALLLLPLTGCVSRSKLKENEALLAECRTDKVSAQTAMTSCEERFAKEVKRWEDMDAVVASVVPGTLAQFKAEREEILKLVPDTTRKEVEAYIDQLTDAMGRGFQVLRDQNESTGLSSRWRRPSSTRCRRAPTPSAPRPPRSTRPWREPA